jgi:hypothetical protein
MNEETFKVRAYGYGELAQLYFPTITKKSATWQLRKWIVSSKKLCSDLKEAGHKPGIRLLTPAQVRIIVEKFGEP